MEPSLRVSLKGLKRTRDAREFYSSSVAYDEGKKPTSSGNGIAGVSMTRERIRFALYTWVDARRFTESRGRLIIVSGSVSATSILQHKFTYQCRFMSTGLKPALGPRPS